MVYKSLGQTERMLDELFGQAERNPEALMEVQGVLQLGLEKKEDVAQFERILLGKLQSNPQSSLYPQLLYWLYIQQKDFDGAFVQAKALDRNEAAASGYPGKLFEVAALALSNADLAKAEEVYGYIASNYPQRGAAFQALKALVGIKEQRLAAAYPRPMADVNALVAAYAALLKRQDATGQTAAAKRSMARAIGFWQQRTDTAIMMLNEIVTTGRANPELTALAKLDMGDLYLLKGEPWESTLLYSQVELDNKESPMGHQAKLRNAKLSFYKNEFALAQEHLDVLKLATSREIANDAMQLSLMIQNNLVLDTLGAGLAFYARADLAELKGDYDGAIRTLDSIPSLFAGHSLLDDLLWKKATIYTRTGRYQLAAADLQTILDKYKDEIYGDDALFALAELNERHLGNKPQAMALYEQMLKDFPGSIFTVEARKRYRALRGDGV